MTTIAPAQASNTGQGEVSPSCTDRGVASANSLAYPAAVTMLCQPADFTRDAADSGIGSYRAKARVNEAAPCDSERKSIA